MKKILILMTLLFSISLYSKSEAQVLKKIGKKIEKKAGERLDQSADRNVDKVLNKADEKTDKTFDDVLKTSSSNVDEEKNQAHTEISDAASSDAFSSSPDGLIMVSDNCSDFIWFKSGAMMEFEFKDGKGEVAHKSKMIVTKIYNEGLATVADVYFTDNMGNDLTMNYKCAGDKLYMDFAAMMEEAMKKAGADANSEGMKQSLNNNRMDFSDGFMSFPKKMYPGQRLEDVSFTIEVSSSPQLTINVTSKLLERKVEERIKVTTSAGTFDCLKISGKRSTTMKGMGMNKNMGKPTVEYVWFSPGIGMVKQESYDEKGNLESSSQLTAYKL